MKPWMSQIEIDTITKYLSKDGVMLEYGCGGSTLHFCDFVKKYYSVEHNTEWYNKMSKLAKPNTKIFHVLNYPNLEEKQVTAKNWDELDHSSRSREFAEYIKFPATLNEVFDAVLVDGRARPECAKFIYDYVKDDGVVFMHDYWMRKHYHVVEGKYKVIDAVKDGQSLVVFKKNKE